MNLKRIVAALSVSAAVTAAGLVGTATSASAAPTDCTVTYGANWAQSICTGGTGEHQVAMRQEHFTPWVGPILCVGNWAPVGGVSYTQCAYHTIVSVWVNRRG